MSKNILLACLVAAVAAAGCTGSMNASVTPGLPGASASPSQAPGAAASGTPTAGASAGGAVGASTTPTSAAPAGNADATMAALFKLGRKWVYDITVVSNPGGTTAGTTSREVTKVEGGKAWVKNTTSMGGKTVEGTEEVDLTKKTDFSVWITTSEDGKTHSTWTQKSVGSDSVTVKAGTYTAMKYVGTLTSTSSDAGASANATQDATFWANEAIGLIKTEQKGSQTTSAAGMEFTVTTETKVELVSITM